MRKKTTCNRDCPDACGIVATVEDGRVVQLQGDPDHPITRGFLCFRTSHFLERQYADDRITTPLIKTADGFREASWDEAMDTVTERLLSARAEGPESIFHYQSGGSLGALMGLCGRFWRAFGPVSEKSGDICTGALDWAQTQDFGQTEASDLADLENAASILIWGKNVYTSSPHTIPFLKAAKKRGARLVLVDPIAHKTAKLCERVVRPRPGGDLALALAVGRLCFEEGHADPRAADWCDGLEEYRALCEARSLEELLAEADVSLDDARFLAETLGVKPCTILVGWGMGRRVNGAQTVRAVDALGAVTGNVGVPGGCVSYYFNRKSAVTSLKGDGEPPRTFSEPLFGAQVLAANPPVRFLWVTAGNPVAMLPDSERVRTAIRSVETVVVVDSWMSDTAKEADIILPVATLLEDDDVMGGYGHHYLGVSRPVVPPLGEARTDLEILQDLAGRVGLGGVLEGDARSWKERAFGPKLEAHGVSLADLEAGPVRNPCAPRVVYEGRAFPTESGKAQLLGALDDVEPVSGEGFPLFLFAVSTPRAQSSQQARPLEGPAEARVHPSSSGGVPDGGLGVLESRLGSMPVRVVHDEGLRADVCWMDKGGDLGGDRAANKLIGARLTDHGEGGALYDERVRISRSSV
jgi:anaerobic selenocysteine-containing dehydrogenase